MSFTDKKLNPEDIISSIQKILPVLDNWMNRTSESKESLNSAVDTSGLRISLVGFDRTVLSIPNNICQRTREDTQNAYYALYDILETDYNITTGQEIIERALEFRKQLELCQIAIISDNQKSTGTKQKTSGGKAGNDVKVTSETAKRKVETVRDQVFICYSHKDKRWLNNLQIHLKPYVRNGSVTAWSDQQISPGSKWLPKIEAALACTRVAVMLVTPNFLASDFIHENELMPLLKAAEKGKVTIIWVPVVACAYKETSLVDYQAACDPNKPLANMKAERNKAWVKICEEIKKAVSR